MAFSAGNQCSVLIGANDVSTYFKQADVDQSVAALDTTTFKATSKAVLPGHSDGKIDLDGLWDPTKDPTFVSYIATSSGQVATVGPTGLALGAVAYLMSSRQISYRESTPVGGLCSIKVGMTADGGVRAGVSLQDLAAQTATGNGSSVDGVAATTAGAVAHLHVSAYSGFTNVVFTVEDSANNSSFSTIGTFTTVTATGSERITIAGNVRQYVRIVRTVTGSGSVTFQASIART